MKVHPDHYFEQQESEIDRILRLVERYPGKKEVKVKDLLKKAGFKDASEVRTALLCYNIKKAHERTRG